MRADPRHQLDRKVMNVWRISALVWIFLCWVCAALPFLIVGLSGVGSWATIVAAIITAVCVALLAFCVGVLPAIRYARWRYEVGEHELDIMRGIFWRKRFVIPFIRVQNTDTKQGPIMRSFGLAQVTVSTAAGEHEIPGLELAQADALRDAIATQARLAQEDL